MNFKLLAAGVLAATLSLAGCVTSETKPIPKIEAKQAVVHIPETELLDVGVRIFDPGIPESIKDNEEALAKKRIYPDLRRAEARYIPTLLRETLEATAHWGAVRVIPSTAEFVDVIVTGKLIDSNGGFLSVDVTVIDAAGRVWIKDKRYQSLVDLGAYKTTAAIKARDPFQNVYSEIANDMVIARDKLTALDRENIRNVAKLRFAEDLAPDAMAGMTSQGQERRHAGGATAGRGRSDAHAHREDPRARHGRGRYGQRLLRELPRQHGRLVRQLAPDQLHRTRKGNARAFRRPYAYGARRRSAHRQHLRAQLLQLLRQLSHRGRGA